MNRIHWLDVNSQCSCQHAKQVLKPGAISSHLHGSFSLHMFSLAYSIVVLKSFFFLVNFFFL